MSSAARRRLVPIAGAIAACAPAPRVSPLPDPAAALALYRRDAGTEAHVRRIDDEMAAAGMRLVVDRRAVLRDGSPAVVRGYRGRDAAGRETWATRAATAGGVVLALGPAVEDDAEAGAVRLVESLLGDEAGGAGAWSSGTDLNGDGSPDVVVRDAAGALRIWRLDRHGSAPYPVRLDWPATRAIDADGDGRPDLAGDAPRRGDPVAPALRDVATFSPAGSAGPGYDDRTQAAVAWHARRAAEEAAREAQAVEARDVAAACRAAIERAWHAARAGEDPAAAFDRADAVAARLAPLPDGVAQAWVHWRGVVRLAPRQ